MRRKREPSVDSYTLSKAYVMLLFCLCEKRRHMASAVEFFSVAQCYFTNCWHRDCARMARSAQASAIVISIIVCILGYLFHVPYGEGVAQLNRVRGISAMMKAVKVVVSRSTDTSTKTNRFLWHYSGLTKFETESVVGNCYGIYSSMPLLLCRDKWANSSVCRLKCTCNGVSNQSWKKLRPKKKTWAWTWDEADDISKSAQMMVS